MADTASTSSVGKNGRGWGFTTPSAGSSVTSGWQPTVVYLLLLVIAELFAFSALRYVFRSVHGG
jgi:hypothetical protein